MGPADFQGVLGVHQQEEAAQRRTLRQEYRSLKESALANREVLANATNTFLEQRLEQLQQLHSKVNKPREHAVDAELFAEFTTCAIDMARKGQAAAKGRTPADFVQLLRRTYISSGALGPADVTDNPAAFDWWALGAKAAPLLQPCAGLDCMLGPLSAEVKLRHKAVRAAKRPLADLVCPDQLEVVAEAEKQETDRHMTTMYEVVRGAGAAVPLAELVCNPVSFSQTVENMFTLSFLVKDQRVALTMDPHMGVMVISAQLQQQQQQQRQQQPAGAGAAVGGSSSGAPDRPPAAAAAAAAPGRGKQQAPRHTLVQFMVNFTMDDWDIMKQVVSPGDCLMPHRPPHDASVATPAAAAAAAKKQRRSQ